MEQPKESKQVELFGLASFHDSALGDLPEGAAKAYGDYAFVRMMCVCGVATVPSHRESRRESSRGDGVDHTLSPHRWRKGTRP